VTESGLNRLDVVVERDIRAWLERAVIGLNLCPFAKAVYVRGQIHYAVSHARTSEALAEDLTHELQTLVALDADVRDTTLLMVPNCLDQFLEFNDFLSDAERILVDLGLDGVIQIASFHPNFQFANTAADDIGNCTNRAPYPTLHLLRETSVDRAVAAFPQAESIFERNIETLEKLGHTGWLDLGLVRAARLPKSRIGE
jgi:hypothetical protein